MDMCTIDIQWHVVRRDRQLEVRDDYDELVFPTAETEVAKHVVKLQSDWLRANEPKKGGLIELLRNKKHGG